MNEKKALMTLQNYIQKS